MPGIIRNTIIQGPCQITFASQTFWSKGDVVLRPVFEYFDVATSTLGRVDQRLRNKSYQITFEPDGRVTAGLLAVLWPYGATVPGTSLFGAADRPLVIFGRDGTKVTVHNAALTQMPAMRLGAGVTLAGQCQFTGLLALSKAVTDAAGYLTVATATYPGDTSFASSEILTQPVVSSWGDPPWAAFEVEAPGWELQPTMSLSPVGVDSLGTVDMLVQDVQITARAVPIGVSVADMLTAIDASGEMGTSPGAAAQDLEITAGAVPTELFVALTQASLTSTEMVWGSTRKRVAQCTWTGNRASSGTLFEISLTTVAPEEE